MELLKENIPATISALDDFIQNLFLDIPVEESRKNLEDGLVEIVNDRYHLANALLITDDGYFLTVGHCFSRRYRGTHISFPDGNRYPLEEFYALHEEADVALGKAAIPGKPQAKRYLFYNPHDLYKDVHVRGRRTYGFCLTRRDGELLKNRGIIRETSCVATDRNNNEYIDHFEIKLPCSAGDSGGIIASPDGRLIGFLSGGHEEGPSDAAKLFDGLEIIHKYIKGLRRRLKRTKKLK